MLLPACASPLSAHSVCSELQLGEAGASCESSGRCQALSVHCGATCTLPLQSAAQLHETLLRQQRWLLFVGDSDTRALVFELLQLLAAGSRGEAAAAQHSELWLGVQHVANGTCFGESSNCDGDQRLTIKEREDWMRRCFLDVVLDSQGRLAAPPASYHCRGWERKGHAADRTMKDYVAFGKDYNLSSEASTAASTAAPGSLRVTYVGTDTFDQTMLVFGGLVDHLRASRARPTAVYVGVGSHFDGLVQQNDTRRAAALIQRAEELGDLSAPPHALVYATVLGLPRRVTGFDRLARPLLTPRWSVLERNTSLARLPGDSGRRGVKLTSGHAPHLINYLDVQRLMAANAFGSSRRANRTTWSPSSDHGTCVHVRAARYSSWCTGFGAGDKDSFMEAYWHFCFVETVAEHLNSDSTASGRRCSRR